MRIRKFNRPENRSKNGGGHENSIQVNQEQTWIKQQVMQRWDRTDFDKSVLVLFVCYFTTAKYCSKTRDCRRPWTDEEWFWMITMAKWIRGHILPKFPDIRLRVEGKLRKNLNQDINPNRT